MVFNDVPIPPSSNNQYKVFRRNNKIVHASSLSLVAFRKEIDAYFLRNMDSIKIARELFGGNKPLSVNCYFAFEKSRIYTKRGHFKRLDVSNRLKALHDAFAKVLLIDDSCFVHVSASKYAVDKKESEHVLVDISVCDNSTHQISPTK